MDSDTEKHDGYNAYRLVVTFEPTFELSHFPSKRQPKEIIPFTETLSLFIVVCYLHIGVLRHSWRNNIRFTVQTHTSPRSSYARSRVVLIVGEEVTNDNVRWTYKRILSDD